MDAKELEEQLAQKLTAGEMDSLDAEDTARKLLPMKTEIRIQAQIDPIVEETKKYRKMAEEVDDRFARYDRWIEKKAPEGKTES
ncbi:hypothetical protein D3C73_705320 [compost metagenome]